MHVPNVAALQRVLNKDTYPDMVLSFGGQGEFVRLDFRGSTVLIPIVNVMNIVVTDEAV